MSSHSQSSKKTKTAKKPTSTKHKVSSTVKPSAMEKELDRKTESSMDSGTMDSGFLSGSNILSGCLTGGILQPEVGEDHSSEIHSKQISEKKSYSLLDSGVDVGITDQLSELNIGDSECSEPNEKYDSGGVSSQQPWIHNFQKDEDGDTRLHVAVMEQKYEVVFGLIQMITVSTYLDIRNNMRETPLHLAVMFSSPQIIKLLLSAGAKSDSVDHYGNTPLHLAVRAGDEECVKALTAPMDNDFIRNLGLKYQPARRPTIPPELNMYNYEGFACVHLAFLGNYIHILKHIVMFGADVDAREYKSGWTLVHMAAQRGDAEMVSLLVKELQADPCPLTYRGESPWRIAQGNPLEDLLRSIGAYAMGDSDNSSDEDHHDIHANSSDDEQMYSFRDLHQGVVEANA